MTDHVQRIPSGRYLGTLRQACEECIWVVGSVSVMVALETFSLLSLTPLCTSLATTVNDLTMYSCLAFKEGV